MSMNKIISSVPLNSTAARVIGKGVHYEPQMRPHATEALIGMPAILRPVKNGKRLGHWTILGLAADSPEASSRKPEALFVVKCSCGRYGLRRMKSLVRARKRKEGCPECKHLQTVRALYRKQGSKPLSAFVASPTDGAAANPAKVRTK